MITAAVDPATHTPTDPRVVLLIFLVAVVAIACMGIAALIDKVWVSRIKDDMMRNCVTMYMFAVSVLMGGIVSGVTGAIWLNSEKAERFARLCANQCVIFLVMLLIALTILHLTRHRRATA